MERSKTHGAGTEQESNINGEMWLYCIGFCLGLAYFVEAQTCTPIDQCSCKFPNGTVITLWDIDRRYDDSQFTTILYGEGGGGGKNSNGCEHVQKAGILLIGVNMGCPEGPEWSPGSHQHALYKWGWRASFVIQQVLGGTLEATSLPCFMFWIFLFH